MSKQLGPGQSERITRYALEEYRKIADELLKDVKGRLGQDKFDEFGKFLEDYTAKRIEITDFTKKVKGIFGGDRDLLSRLNIFFPLEDEQSQQKKPVMEDSIRFLNKMKAQLQGADDHTYKSFKNILVMYHQKKKSSNDVCQEVTTLLLGHPNLLDEFYVFLPKSISAPYIAVRKLAREITRREFDVEKIKNLLQNI